jgi:hypothetical protein
LEARGRRKVERDFWGFKRSGPYRGNPREKCWLDKAASRKTWVESPEERGTKTAGGGGKSRWSVKDIENLTGLIGAKASKETLVRDIGWSIKDILKEAKRMDLDVGYLEKGPMEIVVPLDLVLKVNKIRFDT